MCLQVFSKKHGIEFRENKKVIVRLLDTQTGMIPVVTDKIGCRRNHFELISKVKGLLNHREIAALSAAMAS